MAQNVHPPSTPRWQLLAALVAVYIIWGSTYLGIRFAIETLPPFLMTSTRFLIAGTLLYGWMSFRGTPRPQAVHWRSAFIIGTLMLVGGTGLVTWAEQRVPSSLAALMICTTPLWIALLNWLIFGSTRPNRRMVLGLFLGLVGVAILLGPAELLGGHQVDLLGALGLVAAALSWSAGSLYSRQAPLPQAPLQAASMEMLCSGVVLGVIGTLAGQWSDVHPSHVSFKSVAALLYLILFGSLVAFTAYIWLLRHTTPSRATSYAYVNPVVAVFLGWALAGEELSLRIALASAIIVGSVVLITSLGAQQASRPRPPVTAEARTSASGAGK